MNYKDKIKEFETHLIEAEKSKNTIDKYLRDIKQFYKWFDNKNYTNVTKEILLKYKNYLKEKIDKTSTINSKISSINAYFIWAESELLKIKVIKCQKSLFGSEDKKLSVADVKKLIGASKCERDKLLIETIVRTGIRVSEVSYITVNAIDDKKAKVNNKSKVRVVLIPSELCIRLKKYCKDNNIKTGQVFITRNGTPIDRKQIWRMMKDLCEKAGVDKTKVFPHNLRHLFAREYFNKNKDIVKLASILGHSSIETTRIYTMETEEECRNSIEKLEIFHFRE